MSQPFDIEAYRTWIGHEEYSADIVTPGLVARFNAALDLPVADRRSGGSVPLAIHWCLAPPAVPTARLGPDGHPQRGGFLPPVPLRRRMWAGGELVFGEPLCIGDSVRRLSRIDDVVLKEGRSGPLCFVTVRHSISSGDRLAIEERQDLVYRGLERQNRTTEAKGIDQPATPPRWCKSVPTRPVLLFRYSALTFNAHRIHYDRRYCLEEENYPGLVVHGPLQATLLLHFALEIRGTAPRRFSFRSAAPLFDGSDITLNADETAAGLGLWTADRSGQPAMMAQAIW